METTVEYQLNITETHKIICEKYWLRANSKKNSYIYSCQDIAQEFNMKTQEVTEIVKQNSCLKILGRRCVDCGVAKTCYTRTAFTETKLGKRNNWQCDSCQIALQKQKEQEYLEYCLEQERIKQQHKQVLINKMGEYRNFQLRHIPSVSEIDVLTKLLLVLITESWGIKNFKKTISLRDNLLIPLSPSNQLDIKIIENLFKENVLILGLQQNINSIELNEYAELDIDYQKVRLDIAYPLEVMIQLRKEFKENKEIAYRFMNMPMFINWCRRVQLSECVRYLNAQSRLNNLTPNVGQNMFNLLQECLTKLSVSDMYYVIWKAVDSAKEYAKQTGITRQRASNSIQGNIERIFKNISTGHWFRNPSPRKLEHPQSAIAKVCFDYIFGVEDGGFYYTLNELSNKFKEQDSCKKSNYSTLANVQYLKKDIEIKRH